MPKTIFLCALISCSLISRAQHSVTAGITMFPYYNSLGKFMNDDHLIIEENTFQPLHDSRTYYNYGLNLSYQFDKEDYFHQVQFIGGHRYIQEYYGDLVIDDGYGGGYNDTSWTRYNQFNYGLNYMIGSNYQLGNLSLGGGVGMSVQRIGKGYQDWYIHFEYLYDGQLQYERTITERVTSAGGFGYGLVAELNLEYQLGDNFSLGFSLQNYLMHFIFIEKDHRVGKEDWTDGWMFPDSEWDFKVNNKDQKIGFSRITPVFYCRFAL
ncbi:hypothetical protein K6119_09435 [Paracrocinitomix mangrovi]|uniref:hypothetical protein n=1 Tax=Paracrocinitomix mangrovi TaxID=2862509 RepID=UPI001C8E0C63|nr:hypothetical protein [Paracrocinitomix mangrovi]UKN03712.1 hypothetical protein K6119_09435 [Paracrocinitomix mangrovi]